MGGYYVTYTTPKLIENRLNNNVDTFLRRNGLVGFEPLDVEIPSYRRPMIDGVRTTGRLYTGPRPCGVLTDAFADTHEALAAFIAQRIHEVNPYEDESGAGWLTVYTADGRARRAVAWPTALPIEWNGPTIAFLGYRFFCPYPFFYDPVEKSQSFALSTPGGITFPITFPIEFEPTTIDTVLDVNNAGDITTWPIIRIYGPGQSPVIQNHTTVEELDLNNGGALVLDTGDYVEVDTEAATIYLFDSDTPANCGYIPEKRKALSRFWQLVPGDNEIHVTMSAVTVGSVLLRWYEYYRSAY